MTLVFSNTGITPEDIYVSDDALAIDLNGSLFGTAEISFSFVPVPAALPLFLGASLLLGFVGLRRGA